MKAITLLQPWATLVVIGAKKFETRSWNTEYRGPLLIHASSKKPSNFQCHKFMHDDFFKDYIKDMLKMPYGAIIGRVDLVATFNTLELLQPHLFGKTTQLSDQEKAFGDFTPGRFAWKLENVVNLNPPLPYKGSLSIWEFPDDQLPESLKEKNM